MAMCVSVRAFIHIDTSFMLDSIFAILYDTDTAIYI